MPDYFQALYFALTNRDAQTAWNLLRNTERLSWTKASDYASLTLGWAPHLLARLLDLGPNEELLCRRAFPRPGGNWTVEVFGSLLTAAAAIGDLTSLELLLARGYTPSASFHLLPPERKQKRAALFLQTYGMLPDGEPGADWCRFTSWNVPDRVENYVLPDCDPLAAAIWCGATPCAKRLLETTTTPLSDAARLALDCPPERAQPNQETARALAKLLPPDAFLPPERLLQANDPRFPACLSRHPEWHTPDISKTLLLKNNQPWAMEALELLPAPVLTLAVLSLRQKRWRRNSTRQALKRVLEHPRLRLSIPRNQMFHRCHWQTLLYLLDHAEITGEAPPGQLSGLAMALLDGIADGWKRCETLTARFNHQLLYHPRTAEILADEDPKRIRLWLEQWGEREIQRNYGWAYVFGHEPRLPDHVIRFLLILLGVRENSGYAL